MLKSSAIIVSLSWPSTLHCQFKSRRQPWPRHRAAVIVRQQQSPLFVAQFANGRFDMKDVEKEPLFQMLRNLIHRVSGTRGRWNGDRIQFDIRTPLNKPFSVRIWREVAFLISVSAFCLQKLCRIHLFSVVCEPIWLKFRGLLTKNEVKSPPKF